MRNIHGWCLLTFCLQSLWAAGCFWCIPFRYKIVKEDGGGTSEKIVEVLMINSTGGPGLLFPKIMTPLTKPHSKSASQKRTESQIGCILSHYLFLYFRFMKFFIMYTYKV